MRIEPTVKNANSVPRISLSPIRTASKLEFRIGGRESELKDVSESAKIPSHRLKLKTNCEKKRLLAKQNYQKAKNDSGIHDDTPEATSRFIIDYMPLCFEEDLEMLAFSMAKDQVKQTD